MYDGAKPDEIKVYVFRTKLMDYVSSWGSLAVTIFVSVANHRWGGGSTWIDSLAVILFFLTLFALVSRKEKTSWRGSVDEAIDYLKSIKEK